MTMATSQTGDRSPWDIITGDAERDRRNVVVLLSLVEELYSQRELEDVTRAALDGAIEVTGAQRAILLLPNENGELAPHMARDARGTDLPLNIRYSRSVVEKVWTTGKADLTVDAEDQSAASLGQSILDLRLLSIMGTPLPVEDRNLGVLYVDSTVQVKEFTKADRTVFRVLGGLVALALESGRLRAEEVEQARLKREMAVARDIQQRLFPADIPSPDGFDLAAIGKPCDETSGDYYDVIPIMDDNLAMIVGDVSGHGLGPALYMVSTRALLHSLLHTHPGPRQVIESLNAFLERDMPENSFMSLFLGVLDPAGRSLTYVSAGHNPPLLVRRDGSVHELGRTGPVLGILDSATYHVSEPLAFENGDVLMLYTDGIFEAKGDEDDMYGEERLRASLQRHAANGSDARQILESVLNDLFAFCGDHPLDDDVTALVLRVV